jgi:hypothetical protein
LFQICSKADLKIKRLEFMDDFNKTMAKPFKWTYRSKPLVAYKVIVRTDRLL